MDYNDDEGLEIAFTEIERVVKNGGLVLITVRSVSQQPKPGEVLVTELKAELQAILKRLA